MNLSILIISILGIAIGIGATQGWEWIVFPWQRPSLWKPIYRPSLHNLNHLNRLIKVLGEVHSWLGPGNNPLTQGLQKGLWEQINYLQVEQYSCTAIFSSKRDERVWALRRISQNRTKKVQAVIYAISEHSSASDEIRTIAKEILLENDYEPPTKPKLKPYIPYNQRRSTSTSNNSDSPVIYSEKTVIHMKDGAMAKKDGDTYNVGQAGAVGPNSEAHHVYMTQGSSQNYDELDLDALGKELEILRLELKKLSQSSENDKAIGAIAAAEIEIKRGDRSKAKEYLKQAGTWAFDVATKIGVGLAIVALKNALGL